MAKKSMTPSERREAILKVLCQRRQDKIDNLAFEFGVSVRTIKNDIEELSLWNALHRYCWRSSSRMKNLPSQQKGVPDMRWQSTSSISI